MTAKQVELGAVTLPSGELVIVDTGYLGMWSGDSSPSYTNDEGELLLCVDLEIVGPDATVAATSFDRQPGRWLYDIPEHGVAEFTALFAEHCRSHGLRADLVLVEPAVPHRERVRRCVAGDSFLMLGVPVVVLGGLPRARALPVVGHEKAFDFGAGWESVTVEVNDGAVAQRHLLGKVGVDWARIMLADADGLSSWVHEEPLDGLADAVFWGASGPFAAVDLQVSAVADEPSKYGWLDLPIHEAIARIHEIEGWKQARPDRRLAWDFRPHSHHWQIMRQIDRSPHEAGQIEVGGAQVLTFMTGWGDGFFPVYAERTEDGTLLRVRIELLPADS
ncbi:DUF4241 domain-containing protein [Microtetraspora glauca]|uniref:DUF4241 domain-containing protein n=1 Tax=Microtetraspora glauca TaxID=1996 RepID=A0ABV3GM72_MICGL